MNEASSCISTTFASVVCTESSAMGLAAQALMTKDVMSRIMNKIGMYRD
jgi:hypothetical protein